MPTIASAVASVHAAFQAAFITSAAVPATYQLLVGQEVVMDVDAFTDLCCSGLASTMVTGGRMEPGVVDTFDGGPLYSRIDIALTVLRCAPTIGDDLRSPTVAEHAAYANLVLDDMERMLNAAGAVAQLEWLSPGDMSNPEWAPIEAEGGCGGGAVLFTMAVIGDC